MNAQSVLQELKEQAQRKAALKMYYSAADVFKEYKGPYAQETAVERAQLAEQYDNFGRVAESARWGENSAPPPTQPVTLPAASAPPPSQPAPPPRSPASPPKPKPKARTEVSPPKPVTRSAPKPKPSVEYQVQGNQVIFPCRWCKEPVTADLASGGKIIPCPKCDLLVTVPKV